MINVLKNAIKIVYHGEYRWIPSSLAFYFIISFIPLLFGLSLFIIRYFISDLSLINHILVINNIDFDLASFVQYVKDDFKDASLVISIAVFVVSLFFSCNGFRGIMYAIESMYDLKKISFFKSYLYAILLNLSLLLVIIIMIVLTNFLPLILDFLHIDLKLNLYFLILLIVIFVIIYLSYGLVSDFKLKFKDIILGVLFSTIMIFLMIILSNYIFSMTRFNFLYGSLAFIIVLAHFFFYMSWAIYFGLVLNVAYLQYKNSNKKKYIL
ncbi:MAG: YihY/virulence factor BrkB family protein [Bacilli bacterium]|jgi:uncharacterized BrkB/YihY/UPF0761 family membrane protein|nr:YihY/virulence factor BrkB family protein [Bacilli bacterium]